MKGVTQADMVLIKFIEMGGYNFNFSTQTVIIKTLDNVFITLKPFLLFIPHKCHLFDTNF